MASSRRDRIADELRKIVATFLEKESNRMSLITVTRVTVSKDLKEAMVYITVLPEKNQEGALNFAKRRRKDLRTYVKKRINLKALPFFDISIDQGELNRQKIESLENEIAMSKNKGSSV